MAETIEAPASILNPTLALINARQSIQVQNAEKLRAVIITDRCATCNPKFLKFDVDRRAFIARFNLHPSLEEVLLYPVDSGTNPDIIASGIKALTEEFSGITKVIRVHKFGCEWYHANTPKRIGGKILNDTEFSQIVYQRQIADLMATHRALAAHLAQPNVSVELYHDTGRPVPQRIHLA